MTVPKCGAQMTVIAPGGTIGILGGGQLGRMLAMAAAQLGYRCHVYAPEADSPAADVAAAFTCAAFEDADALGRFSAMVDVVSYEFENVPVAPLAALPAGVLLRPGLKALEVAQSRVAEKAFVNALGGRTARFAEVTSLDDLNRALNRIGTPAILKTNRMGYDGKGQVRIATPAAAAAAWQRIGEVHAILEARVAFATEFSVLVARGADGAAVAWDAPENMHEHGILSRSVVPAGGIVAEQVAEATALAQAIAAGLDYVGVLAVEFFASHEGPVFNEMAPRVHNSGHWTIEGAFTSQFENHVRAICGLPLGDTRLVTPGVDMVNLIGAQVDEWRAILAEPRAHLHLYGKSEARPGRKMGHVTRLIA